VKLVVTDFVAHGCAVPGLMPDALREFVEEKAQPSEATDHTKSIRERLRDLMELFKLTRYQPTDDGAIGIDERKLLTEGHGGSANAQGTGGSGNSPRKPKNLSPEDIYALFEAESDSKGRKKAMRDPFPIVRWVGLVAGTRDHGVIEDRAATYIQE